MKRKILFQLDPFLVFVTMAVIAGAGIKWNIFYPLTVIVSIACCIAGLLMCKSKVRWIFINVGAILSLAGIGILCDPLFGNHSLSVILHFVLLYYGLLLLSLPIINCISKPESNTRSKHK